MRRKILFISSWYPNRREQTNGNFVQRHAEAVARFHDVEVLHAIGDADLNKKFEITENVVNGIRTVIIYYKNSRNPVKNFLNRMKAYRFGFKKINFPDLVHANVLHNSMLFAVYLKRKFKIPFVVSEHWTALQSDHHHKTSAKIKKIAKFIGNNADYILPVSENLKNSLQQLGITTPMQVIGNVVGTEIFQIKHDHNSSFKFFHLSNLTSRKNPEKIIQAVIKLRNSGFEVCLEIGGDGDILTLQNFVKQNHAEDFIKIFGEINYKEVADKMQNADCFVLFSDYENLPCVLLESLSCGVPFISTNVGGIAEIAGGGFGKLIPKDDEQALFEAMLDVVKGNFKTTKPQEMRNFVLENFSIDSIGKQFSEVYEKVLAE